MNNDKFFNYYVELLTSTLHDAIGKNLVFQTQQRIYNEEKEGLENKLEQLNHKNSEIENLTVKRDNHIETFKNELVAARNEINLLKQNENKIIEEYESQIKKLTDQIEYLNLTPAQRRKINKTQQSEINDGGEF